MRKFLMLPMWMVAAMAMVGCHAAAAPQEEDEGQEVKIKFTDAPAAVQATLKQESNGASIESVDKETHKDGKVVYEADAVINGTNYEIVVSDDGKLLKKKIDKEEDEKKEGKEKDKD